MEVASFAEIRPISGTKFSLVAVWNRIHFSFSAVPRGLDCIAVAQGGNRRIEDPDLGARGNERANRSNELNTAAATRRMRFLMRAEKDEEGSRWQRVGPEAAKMAYDDVIKNPEAWQDGKDGAQLVLDHVRQAMPTNALRNAIPASINLLIQAGSMEPLGDSMVLVPQEIRELLDQMVSKSVNTTSGSRAGGRGSGIA